MKKLLPIIDQVNYRTTFIIALISIALGVVLDNRIEHSAIGTVLIAVGGLFLIFTMSKKRKEGK